MKIDIAAHILPPKYMDALRQKAGGFTASKTGFPMLDSAPALSNLDARFRIMDKYGDLVQVLTLAAPAIESVASPEDAAALARIANDEMAELVTRYPDRFVAAAASLPMNNMDAALQEADRAIKDLKFRGVQIFTPMNGQPLDLPQLEPLYQKMAEYDLPIWIHPRRDTTPDYAGEERSRYFVWCVFGWPFESTAAMVRLVFSGVLKRYPSLKLIIHHCGGMVPFLEQRIASTYDYAETGLGYRYKQDLTRPVLDYFRSFYADTAVNGSTPALMCGHAFFGTEHLLFGTDTPFDNQLGDRSIRQTIRSVEDMSISESERTKIFEGNARRLLRLPA